MIKRALGFLLLTMLLSAALHPLIFVKQDKDGRIIISDSRPNPLQKKLENIKLGKISKNVPAFTSAYLAKIRQLCAKYGFREDLVIAVARTESSFNPYAVSHKGAMGIMQLMLETARGYGVNNPFNVDQNLEGGIRHLQYLYKKYNQDLPLTLAAYNAGEDAVAKSNGIPPYPETRRYIQKVLAYMGMSYSFPSIRLKRTRIYRYVNAEGKIVITDTRPIQPRGKIEIFD